MQRGAIVWNPRRIARDSGRAVVCGQRVERRAAASKIWKAHTGTRTAVFPLQSARHSSPVSPLLERVSSGSLNGLS